jgi:hypothetical protein
MLMVMNGNCYFSGKMKTIKCARNNSYCGVSRHCLLYSTVCVYSMNLYRIAMQQNITILE